MQKTYQPKHKDIDRKWHLKDAKGQILGRFASEIAQILIGKHKPSYSRHLDMGDCVVVVNAKEIEVTGRKSNQKVYYKHSGYPGGFSETSYKKLLKESPEKIIEKAVSGMLPRNRLHTPRMRRMKVYAGSKHPYEEKFQGTSSSTAQAGKQAKTKLQNTNNKESKTKDKVSKEAK